MIWNDFKGVAIMVGLALILILVFTPVGKNTMELFSNWGQEVPIDLQTCDIIKPEERAAFEKLGYHFVCCTDRDVSYLLNVPEGESCAICSRSYTETPDACS